MSAAEERARPVQAGAQDQKHRLPQSNRSRDEDNPTAAHEAMNGADLAATERRQQQRKRSQDLGDGIAADDAPLTESMSLRAMLARLVFVADGSRVALREHSHITLPLAEFRVATASLKTLIKAGGIHRTADLWVAHTRRITTHTLTFRPGRAEFTSDPEGALALNLWRPRAREASSASVEPFLRHVEYLVPDAAERDRFLDWLAHIEQKPGELPHTHYLMVAQQTGIGRNWLASLLARVWAGATRLGFDLVGAMHSGFNGPLSRRLLVIVDELKAADTGYGSANHAQQLKSMLTTEHRSINPKFGRMHVELNCARWLMFSQHFDALPLERTDRRVIVIENPIERRPAGYYTALYALLDDADFVAGVARWLGARDIRAYNPSEPAPMTASKVKAVEACVGDIERALIGLRDGTEAVVMTAADISDYLHGCGLARPAARAMSAAYDAVGFAACKHLVSVNGRKTRVVAMRTSTATRQRRHCCDCCATNGIGAGPEVRSRNAMERKERNV
jgi:hypothetical protein